MKLFGLSHLSVIFLTLLFAAGFSLLGRKYPPSRSAIAWFLSLVMIGSKLGTLIYAATHGYLTWQNGLPMHLCDWACITAVIALATHSRSAYELTYFWGLAGTLQAVLTPDLHFDFPDLRFITFFASHCAIIVSLVYLTLGLSFRPYWKSILRVVAWGQVYLATAFVVNWLSGGNYGYLRAKPSKESLMDWFGPWPWYILTLEVLAVIFYVIYYLPFVIGDFLKKKRG